MILEQTKTIRYLKEVFLLEVSDEGAANSSDVQIVKGQVDTNRAGALFYLQLCDTQRINGRHAKIWPSCNILKMDSPLILRQYTDNYNILVCLGYFT